MQINKNDIEKLADLARLEISSDEEEKFAGQITQVLEYVGKLNDLDTSNIEITSQVTDQTNIFRKDEPMEFKEREAILANAPEISDKQIKISSVLRK